METLFKAAIRRTIIDKKPALEEFKAIDEYFIALSDDKSYQESALEGIRNIAAYLSQAMYVQADIRSVEDYVLAKCARLLAEAVGSGVGATLVDGTELLVCRSMDGEPIIDWTLSREQIVSRLGGVSRAIVPGG